MKLAVLQEVGDGIDGVLQPCVLGFGIAMLGSADVAVSAVARSALAEVSQ